MNIDRYELIKTAMRESIQFPILFIPLFITSVLGSVMATDAVIASIGSSMSLWINIVIVTLLSPVAAGIVLLLDRQIAWGQGPDFRGAVREVFPHSVLLITTNLAVWLAVLLGLFLLIIPGIFIYIKLFFVNQEVLLGEAEDVKAVLTDSWNRTTGHGIQLFLVAVIFMAPLVIIQVLSLQLSPSLAATIQVVVGVGLQTWLVVVTTRIYLKVKNQEAGEGTAN